MAAALVLNNVPKNLFLRSLKNRKRGGKHEKKDAAIITSLILMIYKLFNTLVGRYQAIRSTRRINRLKWASAQARIWALQNFNTTHRPNNKQSKK